MKRLNIYLASTFKLKDTIEWLYNRLDNHTIIDKWWNIDSKDELESDFHWYGKAQTKAIEQRHFQHIKKCDALILVGDIFGSNDNPDIKPPSFNGANVEVGYALALGIPVFSIGKINRSAMYVSVIRCEHAPDLERALDILALKER